MLDAQNPHRSPTLLLSVLLAIATSASGCIADEPILEPAAEAVEQTAECQGLIDEGVVDKFTTGEPCIRSLSCAGSDNCSSISADCKDNEDLAITDVSVIDCPGAPATEPVSTEGEPIGDCEVALNDGRSGQACDGTFTCARTADACCVELATCGVPYTQQDTLVRSQHLVRLRICTRDCQNVRVDDSVVATDCSSAYMEDAPYDAAHGIAFGRACSGDFVCMDGVDIRESGVAVPLSDTPSIAFCQGGAVLGRPSVFWLNTPTFQSIL